MSTENLVSIIIPVYNAAQHIAETLDSALAQTYPHVEIICVDDCSTDDSCTIINSYIEDNPKARIQLIQLSQNVKTPTVRNTAIKSASGRYILPLDADDKIAPTYIEKAIHIFTQDNSISVVYSKARFFDAIDKSWPLPNYDSKLILQSNMVFCSAVFLKEDWAKYGGYKTNMNLGLEDWDFWLNFVADNKKFFRIEEELFFYRKTTSSRTTSAVKNEQFLVKTLRKNHASLYRFSDKLKNKHLRKEMLKKIRDFILQVKISKKRKIIRILGITLFNKNKATK